ncbi:hypothetical protein TNCV_1682821 [Trichonephila clavipes]|nr:hypothetical protein TNCV_1682821 [Trichonephila clavipes]
MRRKTASCRQLSLVTKHGVTILNRKQASEQEVETCDLITSKEIKGLAHQFCHCRVDFSVTCSFLAATLAHQLNHVPEDITPVADKLEEFVNVNITA